MSMKYSLRKNALAAVIGLSLAGAAWHAPAYAGIVSAAPAATAAPSQSTTVEPYIVEFVEEGLVRYQGGNAGLTATAPSATHSRKLDVTSSAACAYDAYLESQRAIYINQIDAVLGRNLGVTHSYSITLNGIAADMSGAEAARIAQMPGVKSVRVAGVEYLNTYNSTKFIGADTIWDGSNTPTLTGTRGQGITVGILDSGANSTHPSFANDTACGFSSSNKKLKAVDCSSSSGGVCTGPNPQAASGNGHGVHTAGTVAGNTIDNTASPAPALPNGISMSGIAPCAAIISYKVCQTSSCGGSDILAGIQNAIGDGVDVINFSISGGTSPWNDNDRDFLNAVNADVFVAASAGNTNESITNPVGQVNHRGPWVMSVAASTQDLIIGPSLSLTWPGTPPAAAVGVPLNPGSTTLASATPTLTGTPLRIYPNNIGGCTADGGFRGGYFVGAVAVVQRGVCPFTEKISNAVNAGATMVVIANNQPGSINMDTTGAPAVPAYSISQTSGDAIINFLTPNPRDGLADVAPIAIGNTQPDVIAGFSFRGPTPGNLVNLTKPDITAPGVDIYAATDPGSGNYEFMSGTSMSGPHIAGSAALLRAVHLDWSVTEVKSAIQTTASIGGFMEDGSTAWNIDVVGSGRVDLRKAALAGLTLDETYARFLAANPSGGSINIKDLNLAAVRNLSCTPNCTFTRTVTNKLPMSGTWNTSFQTNAGIRATVSPASFTIPAGGTQVLTITAAPPANTTMTSIGFGHLLFTESAAMSPQQHFSVAIKGVGGDPDPGDDIIFQDGFDGSAGAPVTFVLDDGSDETAIGWTDDAGDLQYPSVWLNRFTLGAAQFPMQLSNIQILWPADSSATGKSVKLVVYTDADGDGDPSNAVLVSASDVTIGSLGSFESYPVSVSVTLGGDLYIGFVDTFAEGGTTPVDYVAALDQDASQNRSWIAAGDDVSPNHQRCQCWHY